MNRSEILSKLEIVFQEFFNCSELKLLPDTVSDDIEEWDSVAHIQLVFEIEEQFSVQFEAEDIHKMNSISILIDKIIELSEK